MSSIRKWSLVCSGRIVHESYLMVTLLSCIALQTKDSQWLGMHGQGGGCSIVSNMASQIMLTGASHVKVSVGESGVGSGLMVVVSLVGF